MARDGVEVYGLLVLGLSLLILLFSQCEQSALEGMKACVTYFPRACGFLKVSTFEIFKVLHLRFRPWHF